MKIGIIVFAIILFVIFFLVKVKLTKEIFKNISIGILLLFVIYTTILIVQPNDDGYIKYTKTTIVK
jgi:Mn2+/Fe2+ NRAMP family transporter